MHVAIALIVALVVVALLLLVAGAGAFIAIPIALVIFGAILVVVGVITRAERPDAVARAATAQPAPGGHVPTTSEASYDPVVRPEERPR